MGELSAFFDRHPLREGLVVSLEYFAEEKECILVYDCAAFVVSEHFARRESADSLSLGDAAESYRTFFRVILHDVVCVSARDDYNNRTVDLHDVTSRVRDNTVVIVDYLLTDDGGIKEFTLILSSSCSVTITFASSSTYCRRCRVHRVAANEWKYFDETTNDEVDFYQPFA